MKEKLKRFFEELKNSLNENEVFRNNEIQANKLVARIMILCMFLLVCGWILMMLEVFIMKHSDLNIVVVQGLIELSIPLAISFSVKHERWWVKYLLLTSLIIVFMIVDSFLTYKVALLMTVPVILSSRYFSKELTIIVAVLTVILFCISTVIGTYFGLIDINVVSFPMGTTVTVISRFLGPSVKATGLYTAEMLIKNTLLYSFLPKLLIFTLVAVISVNIAERGRKMVIEQDISTKKSARIDSELSLARDIQNHLLPNTFPAFPDHTEFDLHAIMRPAKEVGGDFYDFFMVDRNHLAIVMADVSGKSIPAALFMVIARTLIKNETMTGKKLSEVFRAVNNMLCEGNDLDLFVTAWAGIMNCETGYVTYVNAGHTPPLLIHEGKPEIIKCKPNFILGGMKNIEYPSDEMNLSKGDIIYLYTDGVTEAEDKDKELYGMDRLLSVVTQNTEATMADFCNAIRNDVDSFQDVNEQFDDLTMLALKYLGNDSMENEITLEATLENIPVATSFVNRILDAHKTLARTKAQFSVAVDELLSNISKYAYPNKIGKFKLKVIKTDKAISLVFTDSGIPFNPLTTQDPDVTSSAEKRKIGGLGIFVVKNSVDHMDYKYENGQNVLTITKDL